jgi:hypothetical protein
MLMNVPSNPGRAVGAMVAVAVSLTFSVVVVAQPASANHQNCGERYPAGTLSNGHPDTSASHDVGWAGRTALNNIETQLLASTSSKELLYESADVTSAAADILGAIAKRVRQVLIEPVEDLVAVPIETAEKALNIVATAMVVGAMAALIAETAYMGVQRALEVDVGEENACNGTVTGDMLSDLWVATVEHNLASDGPPLAMLLIPTDSEEAGGNSPPWPLMPQHEDEDFAWCPEIDLPETLPLPKDSTDLDQPNGASTGGDCVPTVPDGFLDTPYEDAPTMTVQAIVSDAIDHAEAHGLDVRDANDQYDRAVSLVADKRYKDAYAHFRLAYQAAAGFDG